MPATTLRLDDTATHANFLQWVCTPAVQDTAAGGSVDITTVRVRDGGTAADPSSLTLTVTDDAGTVIRSYALNVTADSQVSTFHFTNTGDVGGVARADTVEIKLRATQTGVGAYDVETDGNPNTPPAVVDAHLTRGWVRSTTTIVEAVSNIALGGGKTSPAEYDESLFVRTTAGAASYIARSLTVASSAGSLSAATNSTTAVTRDVTFTNVVDDRFPVASTVVTWTVTPTNASISGQPWTSFTTTTDDTITVDPRLLATLHFQVDDDVFGIAKHDAGKAMLSSQSGFLWPKVTAARGTAINGVTINQSLDPAAPGTTISGTATATTTQDGTVGVGSKLDWIASKPGGSWAWTCDITAPTDIDNNAHLTASDTVTMLAPNPEIAVLVAVSTGGEEGDHLHAGDPIAVEATLFNRTTRRRIAPDTGSVACSILRWNQSSDHFEFLELDGTTWTEWAAATPMTSHPLTTAADTVSHTLTLGSTTSWGNSDIVAVQVYAAVDGTPYGFYVGREMVGGSNGHNGYALDPMSFAGLGFR